jgi:hypothetical protein
MWILFKLAEQVDGFFFQRVLLISYFYLKKMYEIQGLISASAKTGI